MLQESVSAYQSDDKAYDTDKTKAQCQFEHGIIRIQQSIERYEHEEYRDRRADDHEQLYQDLFSLRRRPFPLHDEVDDQRQQDQRDHQGNASRESCY